MIENTLGNNTFFDNTKRKIAVVVSANLRWTPFYYRYETILKANNCSFDLIIWDREQNEVVSDVNTIKFNCKDTVNNSNPQKVFKFIKYALFIKRVLKKYNYSKILFLGTYAGIPALISRYLENDYQQRYWIDIRDITYENFILFFKAEERAIKNAKYTAISSHGFQAHLPIHDYLFIHNIDPSMDDICKYYKHTNDNSGKIRISYIGNIGFLDEVEKFVSTFANDERFLLCFYGNGSDKVENFCMKKGINNTMFQGAFPRESIIGFYNKTDIIYNVYGNKTLNLKTAVSNKLYYALKFELPMIVSPNTYMSEICHEHRFGIDFENSENFKDILYDWYQHFDKSKASFKDAWEKFYKEDAATISCLVRFINS